ncbi:biotin-dependent carboxyltransferase family protein [Nocardioides marmotae]|uniref:5-oxoprolinase/urea amidolyase family protein n=1 Tax=Nocardioides marmotae TaxID=2663857 RepID=A0A6I3JBZ8_9ACTN|nr:biotin-dependent carboxyltransferase family protein [Nocardioides marmotae]MCR6032042.1 5-oxoprolinase/urea amidolyase family protein [Gordonia jinghuaiqii]MBC9732012.1 biotin-dependent carboxyltransferase family protein [Nocardioides marmotae]MTB83133.1 5-oxoprolinase/urea amidolyase family protein [Nocardioides marmotae]MTB95686.1 5-oxoprolinase/urea amidolyase family protein [Nocardioides marmotae]QKE01093.1 biotin-dependent carboxyltransferase family protein [Nocardioides marmotae]
MSLRVLAAGHLTTVQDRGRPGHAHLGVPRAGALDGPAAALANRLVGNPADAAVLEVTLGGLVVRAEVGRWVAVTGAEGPVHVDGAPRGHARAEWLPAGSALSIGTPRRGVRSYVAVGGGLAVEPVLGSRSTDTLGWTGPPRVVDGAVLPVGEPGGGPAPHETPRPPAAGPLRVHPGPRADWFAGDPLARLCAAAYTVQAASNRVGLRLDGPPLERSRAGELASEGMVLGAVQVPPDGRPVVFLADHPVTGGYPVVAVVDPADLWRCAQLRPGEEVRFIPA